MMNASTVLRPRNRPQQRTKALFPLDSDAWRRWSSIHPFLMRHGVLLDALTFRYAPHMPC
jgi:hypothetical protein